MASLTGLSFQEHGRLHTRLGVARVAEVAFDVNERSENIGARRLHTVMERLLEATGVPEQDGGAHARCAEHLVGVPDKRVRQV